MKTYSYYKDQIEGLNGVLDTVKSSEKIAAANIHFLKLAVARLKTYTDAVETILGRLSMHGTYANHPLLKRLPGKKGLIVISGEKGLVGGLWHNIVNQAVLNAPHYHEISVMGAKGKEYLREEGVDIYESRSLENQIPEKGDADRITAPFFTRFMNGDIAAVDILYPGFSSLAVQQPRLAPLLPFAFLEKTVLSGQESNQDPTHFPIIEPSRKAVFDMLLKKHISTYFYRIMLESKLSEFSARTVASEHAAEQTRVLIRKYRVAFSKDRRAAMTSRQFEIFSSHMKV